MDSVLPGLDAAPNIHPLFVHFPVALWPVTLVAMAFAYIKKDDKAYQFGTALLLASVLAGLAAALTGWLASDAMGHAHPGHELIHDHRNLMLAALLVSLGAGGAAWWCRRPERRSRRWIPVGLLLVCCLLTVLGADRGALLVYGHGVGVRSTQPASPAHSHDAERTASNHAGHSH